MGTNVKSMYLIPYHTRDTREWCCYSYPYLESGSTCIYFSIQSLMVDRFSHLWALLGICMPIESGCLQGVQCSKVQVGLFEPQSMTKMYMREEFDEWREPTQMEIKLSLEIHMFVQGYRNEWSMGLLWIEITYESCVSSLQRQLQPAQLERASSLPYAQPHMRSIETSVGGMYESRSYTQTQISMSFLSLPLSHTHRHYMYIPRFNSAYAKWDIFR